MKFFATAARSFLITVTIGLPFAVVYKAFAQDRTISVREVDVVPLGATIMVQSDGGCLFTAQATVTAPSVLPQYSAQPYAFNGARCTALKNAILQAAKNDLQIGTGAAP